MRYIENCEDAIRFCRERIPHFCKLTDLQRLCRNCSNVTASDSNIC